MMANPCSKEKIIVIIGCVFILSGLIMNEWTLAALFSSDGVIAVSHKIIIWIVDLGLIVTGLMLIIFKRSLTKGTVFVITGLLFTLAGILFIEMVIPILMDTPMSNQNRIFLRIIEAYFIITGLMVVLYCKSIDFKRVVLFGFLSLFCFTLFLGYDYYSFYSKIIKHRTAVSDFQAKNPMDHLFVQDDKLGWKLIANASARYSVPGEFDITYETDENGFRKIKNTAENPDFSIYFFGDSFTFGDWVKNEDTFTSIIKEKYLTKEINVYNAGVDGYGIVQMFQRFLMLEDQIQPGDLVIFTPISDDIKRNLTDFAKPYFVKFSNTMKVDSFPFFDNGEIRYRKMENSLYNKLKFIAITAEYTGTFFRSIRNTFISDTTKEAQEMIKIIEQKTKLKGGKFFLFFLPETGERLNKTYTEDISGFNYFDIMHFFPSEEEKLNKLRLNKEDQHYSIRGHEIAAKAIVETLLKAGIIDDRYLSQNL